LESTSYGIKLLDAKASSMHDEKSWELSFLEYGAHTFTILHPGNKYVSDKELTRAIEKNDDRVVAKLLQGMVSMMTCPVAYLTRGKQHPIDCMKGIHFSIRGYGDFSLSDIEEPITRELLIKNLEKAKNRIWDED
ncbi:MAG: hypothetical protein LPK09_13050, partial [Hymenobacteraceae bacterium]|nr:hypothetical protein [Hymenobacteraceae bacterium]